MDGSIPSVKLTVVDKDYSCETFSHMRLQDPNFSAQNTTGATVKPVSSQRDLKKKPKTAIPVGNL